MVEILCTLTGIIAGSAAVATIMHQQVERERAQFEVRTSVDESLRLKVLADQLQLLTTRVSADVTAHNERVCSINERLDPNDQNSDAILSAINELISANAAMQSQLADAQSQIQQQSQQIELTATEARTDSLTGLANRRALNEYLHACVQPTPKEEVSALFMLDIDHFKSCNDTHGHMAGDAVLAMFARRINEWCSGRYYAARYGGEEFAVILSGNSIEEVVHQAAKVRSQVSNKPITYLDLTLKLTASGGLTQLSRGETIESAYARADEGLYRAKKEGRNCGYWLSGTEWLRLETIATEDTLTQPLPHAPELQVTLPPSPTQAHSVPSLDSPSHPSSNTTDKQSAIAAKSVPMPTEPAKAIAPSKSARTETTADVLDLSVFLQRLEIHFQQLGRANLPAASVMLDAVGLKRGTAQATEMCWSNTLALIQSHVRGIDVICRINETTVCIFMPGAQLDGALERASRMQQTLASMHKDPSVAGPIPDRLSIALASVTRNESPGAFMQRLESALDEARDSQLSEPVIHQPV